MRRIDIEQRTLTVLLRIKKLQALGHSSTVGTEGEREEYTLLVAEYRRLTEKDASDIYRSEEPTK